MLLRHGLGEYTSSGLESRSSINVELNIFSFMFGASSDMIILRVSYLTALFA